MKTIKSRLILSYSLISLAIICSLAIFYTVSTGNLFRKYAENCLNNRIDNIIKELGAIYDESTGKYDMKALEIVGDAALQNGIMIRVKTDDGKLDWNIQTSKGEECQGKLEQVQHAMTFFTGPGGEYEEKTYRLGNSPEAKVRGKLTVGYYGPYFYNDNEIKLIGSLNRYMIFIGGGFLFIAVFFGWMMAGKISRPLSSVTRTAKQIAQGEYGVQVETSSSIEEIKTLIIAVNTMSLTLEKEEKQKRQISSDVAHELRTPLTNLQGQLEAMIDGIWEPTEARLESCHEEILRLIRIVRQLQELYILENRTEPLQMEYFNFTEVCRKLQMDFMAQLQEKELTLKIDMPEDALCFGDQLRLIQCMVNLIANAVKYAERGTEIVIDYCKIKPDSVKIGIHNFGQIIPQEAIPHLFERFYRVDRSRNVKTGGMGIGLAITKAIVDRHNGKIGAESGEDGTSFYMELPLPEAEKTLLENE